jgi:hypothetical protein
VWEETVAEGNRIEDYDLDALVKRFKAAEARAFKDERTQDASDFLIAQHLVCILRGDFETDAPSTPEEPPFRVVD